ncbi:MAG: hypothetical protein ACREM9_02590, partial [Gemmatimonadales bacterium]
DRDVPSSPERRVRWRVPAAAAGTMALLALAVWWFYPAPPEESGERPETIVIPPSVLPATEDPDTSRPSEDPPASTERRERPPVEPPREPVSEDAARALESYRKVLRFDLPADSARQVIASLEALRSRLTTRRDSVEADIYRAEAYALTGDNERACAILESARPRATSLQRQKMELWVSQGLCPPSAWKSS